ncbi:MAG: phospho-N-acetylmuramoyl-pentapeptide-transferase [Thermodesulfobacteriota bacterium]
MLYHLLYPLHTAFTPFNVFRYITFRTLGATVTALVIALWLGPAFIRSMQRYQIGQVVRDDGPQTHLAKTGVPTMGGILILLALGVATLLWVDLTNRFIWMVLGLTLWYGLIGFLDDYRKIKLKNPKGLAPRWKFLMQVAGASVVAVLLFRHAEFDGVLALPFFKNLQPDLGIWYIPFAIFVVVGCSNAVNLTDGLDGLATGPTVITAAVYLLFSYLAGHATLAAYLQIPAVRGAGELAVFCGALVGASLGFLWFNAYPAQMFMGDVGALALGGALGLVAVVIKQEILLAIVGGIFVVEALSVIFQVGYFKMSGGKRIFRMAPLHHHFEVKGWVEPKVIVRFWIVSIVLALLALGTLKLR